MNQPPVVSICMITYNHRSFIAQAIEGVLMQKCNFKIELIIADDCSPDDTESIVSDILRKDSRANIISYTKHVKNKGMNENFLWALNQCRGKYIALCEGDDYWSDVYKLQKQVDFLEANKEVGLVHSNLNIVNEFGKVIIGSYRKKGIEGDIFENLCRGNLISTLTVCFRSEFVTTYYSIFKDDIFNWKIGDYPFWLFISSISRIKYLGDVTACYRVHSGSATDFVTKYDKYNRFIEDIDIVNVCLDKLSINPILRTRVKHVNKLRKFKIGIELKSKDIVISNIPFNCGFTFSIMQHLLNLPGVIKFLSFVLQLYILLKERVLNFR